MNNQLQQRMSDKNTPSLLDFATPGRSKSGRNFCSEFHKFNDSSSRGILIRFLKDLRDNVKDKNIFINCLFTLNLLLRDKQLFLSKNEGIKSVST